MSDANWLPNLVGGVSLWKLAEDLNAATFMDGRLLVPHTDGSDSLPTNVEWDVGDLVPLASAQASHGPEVEAALGDFAACLARVADEMKKPESGFHGYRDAFTVPALSADDGAHYFYSPTSKKVFVTNWGASPRDFGAKAGYLFSWDHFGAFYKSGAALTAGGAKSANGNASAEEAPAAGAPAEQTKADDAKDADERKRPIWHYILFFVLLAAIIALLLLLLKGCRDDALTADRDGAADASTAALSDSPFEASIDAGGAADASTDASPDASDAGGDASADAGKEAGGDAGDAGDDDWDEDGDDPSDGSGGGSGGGGGGGAGGGGAGGGKKVTVGPAGAVKGGPHRVHVHPSAVAWRITAGNERVARTVERGKRYDVYLAPGKTFNGVRVEYIDAKGQWHTH